MKEDSEKKKETKTVMKSKKTNTKRVEKKTEEKETKKSIKKSTPTKTVKEKKEEVKKEVKPKKEKSETKKEEKPLEEKSKTKEFNGSYFVGFLGAVLGGLIATIPWILMYVYGNMMLSALSIVIAAGEFYGYKLFKGKVTKKLPITIMVLAVLIVVLTTLVIIPVFLLMSEGININLNSIKFLYQSEEFTQAIIKDTIIAVIFTLLGASVITANIRRQLKNGNIEDIDLTNSKEAEELKNKAIEKIKPIFKRFNAMEKEHGILKDELNAEVSEDEELKTALNTLKAYKIVKKSGGRFYYLEESENKQLKAKNKNVSKIVTVVIAVVLVAVMVGVVVLNQMGILNIENVSDDKISFSVNGRWISYQSYYTYGNAWTYYRYINTPVPVDEKVEENDPTKWPAYLTVSYSTLDLEEMSSLEEVKESFKEYINSLEETPDIYEEKIEKTKTGYDILKIKIQFEQTPQQVEYVYHIMNGDQLATIDSYSYNLADEQEIKTTVENIANAFKWK